MPDVSEKAKALLEELRGKKRRNRQRARSYHRMNIGTMVLVFPAMAGAFWYGFRPNHTTEITAALGLIPGGLALFAQSLRLEDRAKLHFRKAHRLEALLHAAEYERADPVTQEQMTEMSRAYTKMMFEMESEWEKATALRWDGVRGSH